MLPVVQRMSDSSAKPVGAVFRGRAAVAQQSVPPSAHSIVEALNTTAAKGEADAERAQFWSTLGHTEHASIASFAVFAQRLVAVAAPADMLCEALQCGVEEVNHANMCYAAARRYGATVDEQHLTYKPHSTTVHASNSWDDLLDGLVEEGCIAETEGALWALKNAEAEEVRKERKERGEDVDFNMIIVFS